MRRGRRQPQEAASWPVPVQENQRGRARTPSDYRRLLDLLQRDFPLNAQPFAAIGERLGLPEEEVLARVRRLKGTERGRLIRQISAIFDTTALGYKSTLVAMQVPQGEVDRAAAAINRHPGVSHNYQRDHAWNLWFTLAVPPEEDLEASAQALVREAGGYPYRLFPALRVFKIGVRLDMEGADDVSPTEALKGVAGPLPPSPAPATGPSSANSRRISRSSPSPSRAWPSAWE